MAWGAFPKQKWLGLHWGWRVLGGATANTRGDVKSGGWGCDRAEETRVETMLKDDRWGLGHGPLFLSLYRRNFGGPDLCSCLFL